MDIRPVLILVGLILILGSWYFGDWAIWLGAPFFFFGIILRFLDRG